MKVFTISDGTVSAAARVEKLHLKGAGIDIPAILIGEEGRGRRRDTLPVQLLPEQYKLWQEKGVAEIKLGDVGVTKAGKPKVFERMTSTDDSRCLVILRTSMGFRGGNGHTGDRSGSEKYIEYGVEKERSTFHPFPGQVIATGAIAQGDAGRMGSGEQLIAIMPQGTWFRSYRTGRLYNAPGAYYYRFDGETIKVFTWPERKALLAAEQTEEEVTMI